MAKVSLNQAAKDTGVSLPTLSRWRKSGKISAEKNGTGGYLIDRSEYDRIQELRKQSPNMKAVTKQPMKHNETRYENPNEIRVLQVEVEVLRERMKDKDRQIDDLRIDRDEWKKQAQTLLLQPPETPHKNREGQVDEPDTPTRGLMEIIMKRQNLMVYGLGFFMMVTLGVLSWLSWLTIEGQESTRSLAVVTAESKTETADTPLLSSPRWKPFNDFYLRSRP